MAAVIDYYYAPISGYAYLGEPRLVEIATATDSDIRYKPVDIARVFDESGTVPPFKQSRARLDYRLLDLQRTADELRLPINPKPRYWPVPAELAARTIHAAAQAGVDVHAVSFALLSAVYAREQDISDPAVIQGIIEELGHTARIPWESLHSDTVSTAYEQATREAIELGVFGSPTYIVNGEDMFFGQDRLEMLANCLSRLSD